MKNGVSSVKDPITGNWVDASTVQVSTDHILPQSFFKTIPGFKNLPEEVQTQLVNDPANLQPMLSSANSSKNNRVEFTDDYNFAYWKGKPVSEDYRAKLETIQKKIEVKVKKAILANSH